LNEQETQAVLDADDKVSAVAGLVAAAPPPVQWLAVGIGAYLLLEKESAKKVDQGNGVCFFETWAAIVTFTPQLIIPTANSGPLHNFLDRFTFQAVFEEDQRVVVLAADGNLYMEHAGSNGLFGAVPPPSEPVDGNVQAFQARSPTEIVVLHRDGNLWMEHAESNGLFGAVPPRHEPIDANVAGFRALSATEAIVLGSDGNLWMEHAGPNGLFGAVPPPREPIDGNVKDFQPLSNTEVVVLGTDGNLWMEHAGPNGLFGAVPPPREPIDFNVKDFQALLHERVVVLNKDGTLYMEYAGSNGLFGGAVPPFSEPIEEGDVAGFQVLSTGEVVVLDKYGHVRMNYPGNQGQFRSRDCELRQIGCPPRPEQFDENVAGFRALSAKEAIVLHTDGNLWMVHAGPNGHLGVPVGPPPGPREQIDTNVATPSTAGLREAFGLSPLIPVGPRGHLPLPPPVISPNG
jgi:hypothetical protein